MSSRDTEEPKSKSRIRRPDSKKPLVRSSGRPPKWTDAALEARIADILTEKIQICNKMIPLVRKRDEDRSDASPELDELSTRLDGLIHELSNLRSLKGRRDRNKRKKESEIASPIVGLS